MPRRRSSTSAGSASPASTLSFVAAIALAFVGGLLLNLMPCVFPVLSLKVMGFVSHHDAKATMRSEALAYAVGVVLSFVLLALALVALRAAGEQLGWGFQLQSPAVVAGLAVLFFVLALNLSGVFEFAMFAPQAAAGWTSKNRTLDAFGSGVLAVIVASPCTAPFMGAALGYAIAQSLPVTLAVFVALGVGMALPYVLLAWFPGWRQVAAPAGRVDGAGQAGAGLPALRDGGVARVGAGRAGRQRCGAAPRARAGPRGLRAVELEGVPARGRCAPGRWRPARALPAWS